MNTTDKYCITEKESVVVSFDCDYIKSCMFQNNESIKEIRFLNPNTKISANSFSNCKNLEFIALPADISKIEPYTFAFCQKLSSICIPENVNTIDCGVFVGCNNLRKVVVPKKIEKIGDNAFVSCDSLLLIEFNCKKGEELIKFDGYEKWGLSESCKIKFQDWETEKSIEEYLKKDLKQGE